jgi:transposase InsO family protein
MAKYEALLHGLRIAKEIGIKHIICCGDSDLVAQQVAGTWQARNSVMAAYRDEVDELAKCFLGYEVKYVPRDNNTAADMLSKLGSGRRAIPPGIFLEHLRIPSVKGADEKNPDMAASPAKEVMVITPDWTKPFLDYIMHEKLPEDEVLARQIQRRARSYVEIDGQLYKRSATGIFQKCISPLDGIEILREIHLGDCGHHAAPRSLVAKAFRQGFYWLTAKADAEKLVKHCRGCQYYARQPNAPAAELRTIPITWPFAVWNLDMVGKLKRSSSGSCEFLLVAIDKFTKWIEARPVRKADGATALKFVRDLVARFGLPHSIITDNGTNFAHGDLKEYCHEKGIRLDLASVSHPQSNGQVERANALILQGIKPRLEAPLRRAAGAWAEELPSVLWSLRTTPNRSTGFTPFFLVYGAEAVLPSDILHDAPRVSAYNEVTADEAQQLSVDLLEEERNLADQRSAIYQQKLHRYHSRRVRQRSFKEGDLVLRLRQEAAHKLAYPWEGPFIISKALHNGSYYLVDIREIKDRKANFWKKRKRSDPGDIYDETERPWNIAQLRPFHT